jgi:hypothetical protein
VGVDSLGVDSLGVDSLGVDTVVDRLVKVSERVSRLCGLDLARAGVNVLITGRPDANTREGLAVVLGLDDPLVIDAEPTPALRPPESLMGNDTDKAQETPTRRRTSTRSSCPRARGTIPALNTMPPS